MLCMSGDAGSVGLLWRRTDSGGICRVVYVWACGIWRAIVCGGGVQWQPVSCVCPGMRRRAHHREWGGCPVPSVGLCMSGHAWAAKTLWKKVVSGGIH